MKKISFESFKDNGLLAEEDTLDYFVQMDIFSHRFTVIPDMIRAGNLFKLNQCTLELLASYLEGKVKTEGQFKRPEDMTKLFNIWMLGKIYEELLPTHQNERKRLLFNAVYERCSHLTDAKGKQLTKRNIREYFDQYELQKKDRERLFKLLRITE